MACPEKQKPGGCQLHNLHCGWPKCDERTGPSGDVLSDFSEGQWWLKELDNMVATGTDDQKRAVAVVRNLLATARNTLENS